MVVESSQIDWQQMLDTVRPFVDNSAALRGVHKSQVISTMVLYKSKEDDYKSHAIFDDSGYSKNLIEQSHSDNYNIIIMCWKPGQESAFHAHEGSKCFVKILSGELTELQVDYPKAGSKVTTEDCRVNTYKRDQVTYIDDTIGLHKMINKSQDEPAISLHIYKPAYTKCRIFPLDQEEKSVALESSNQLVVEFNNK